MNILTESIPPHATNQQNPGARIPVSSAPPPGPAAGRILIVSGSGDGQAARDLSLAGHEVHECRDLGALCVALKHQKPDVVFVEETAVGPLDQTLRVIRGRHQSVPVVLLTPNANAGLNPIRFGYYGVLSHPVDAEQLMVLTAHALAHHRMSLRIAELEVETSGHGFLGIVGRSAAVRRLYRKLQAAAASDVHVLLMGEDGTGKSLAARAIHDRSARARGPFIALNGANLSDTAFSAEALINASLGGPELRRNGALDDADRGTLYIANIEQLGSKLQAQLLAALRNPAASDFRLIASTKESFESRLDSGEFRPDLYSHIVQHPIRIPPLRNRPMDIVPSAEFALDELARERGRGALRISPEALNALESYPFPGNLAELREVLGSAAQYAGAGRIELDCLPARVRGVAPLNLTGTSTSVPPDSLQQRQGMLFEMLARAPMKMRDIERCAIEATLQRTGDNVTQAMRDLGIGRTTLYRKLKKYGRR
jgi:DNA-binding NtrC family response regulator